MLPVARLGLNFVGFGLQPVAACSPTSQPVRATSNLDFVGFRLKPHDHELRSKAREGSLSKGILSESGFRCSKSRIRMSGIRNQDFRIPGSGFWNPKSCFSKSGMRIAVIVAQSGRVGSCNSTTRSRSAHSGTPFPKYSPRFGWVRRSSLEIQRNPTKSKLHESWSTILGTTTSKS